MKMKGSAPGDMRLRYKTDIGYRKTGSYGSPPASQLPADRRDSKLLEGRDVVADLPASPVASGPDAGGGAWRLVAVSQRPGGGAHAGRQGADRLGPARAADSAGGARRRAHPRGRALRQPVVRHAVVARDRADPARWPGFRAPVPQGAPAPRRRAERADPR